MALFNRSKTRGANKDTHETAVNKKVPKIARESKKPREAKGEKKTMGVILRSHLTERSAHAAEHNIYVFAVRQDANKIQIKEAIEGRFGVGVRAVRTLQVKPKERRRGPIIGWKPGFKKAMVTLKEGHKIETQ